MRNPFRTKNLRARFWPAYVAAGAAVLLSAPSPTSLLVGSPWWATGLLIRAWGAGHLVKNDELVVTGPYAIVRHPFYLGTLCIGVGFACMLGGWSAVVSLGVFLPWFFGVYFPRKERIEAERLHRLHGRAYDRYHDAVPALWPVRGLRRAAVGEHVRWSWRRYDDNNELGTLLACVAGFAAIAGWTLARG